MRSPESTPWSVWPMDRVDTSRLSLKQDLTVSWLSIVNMWLGKALHQYHLGESEQHDE